MTNIPIKPKFANLQAFYKKFPLQKYVSNISLPLKQIEYSIPDIFIDKVVEAAQRLINRDSLPFTVCKSGFSSTHFIVKEVCDAN